MPVNKNALARYIAIDSCLTRKNKHFFSAEDLMEYIASRIDKPIGLRTLQDDIRKMRESSELGFYAPIEFDRREGGYYYSDSEYTIGRFVELNDLDLQSLEFAINILDSYRNLAIVNDFRGAIDKIVNQLKIKNELSTKEYNQFVVPEQAFQVEGIDWLQPLIHFIKNKKVIEVTYHKFGSQDPIIHVVHPFLLKEFNNRWYLLCLTNNNKRIMTLGLDRIKKISETEEKYIKVDFDKSEYFKHFVGITAPQDEKPVKVVVKFDPLKGKYIKTKPIHHSQRIIKDNEKELQIELFIVPTYEFKAFILGCGYECKILQPKSLQKEIVESFRRAIEQY